MNENIVSAVFDSHSEAETAVRELQQAGVRDSALSVIARKGDGAGDYGDVDTQDAGIEDDDVGFLTRFERTDALIEAHRPGVAEGHVVEGAEGREALAIPGVGPLVAAGAIATSAIPGAAAIGAGVGAVAGGLTGLLTDHGVSEEDAGYYEGRINDGGVFVSVDTADAGISAATAQDILYRYGGHSASRSKTAAAL